jgi:hypothetical protein
MGASLLVGALAGRVLDLQLSTRTRRWPIGRDNIS